MSEINIQKIREFHSQKYNIILKYDPNSQLNLILESQTDTSLWKNTFTNQYIEDLSQKTGKKKNFEEFCSLLSQGVKNEQQNIVTLDILTYQDLENMKAKKQGLPNPNPSQLNPVQIKANKRYIILSVGSQQNPNEKVHYPLTLNHEETEDVDKLRQTVQRLKMELEEVKSSRDNISVSSSNQNIKQQIQQQNGKEQSFFITENMEKKLMNSTNSSMQSHQSEMSLVQENELLKTKIKRLEENFSQKKGALEVDQIIKKKVDLEMEIETMKLNTSREINRLQQTLNEKDLEINKKRDEIKQLRLDLSQNLTGDEGVKRLKDHLHSITEQTETEIIRSRKTIQSLQKDNDKAQTDIDFFKRQDQKQKNRIRQLEIELETATKRGTANRGLNDRLYSPYNKNSLNTAGRRANSVPIKSQSPGNRYNRTPVTNTKTPGYQRNTSGENLNRNKISPSYNYGYKRSTVGGTNTSANNTRQVGGYPRNNSNNTSNINKTNTTTQNRNISPGYQRYGVHNRNNSNTNTRQSPGISNRQSPGVNRQSPGVNTRQSPATNTRQQPGANRYPNRNTSPGMTNNRQVSPGITNNNNANNKVSPGVNRQTPSYMRPTNTTKTSNLNNSNSRNSSNANRTYNRNTQPNSLNTNNTTTNTQKAGVRQNSPGNRYNQSPGTRYNNYMNQKKPVTNNNTTNNRNTTGQLANNNNHEFNDKHLKGNTPTNNVQNKDLDNRLDRLQNLLSKAKK